MSRLLELHWLQSKIFSLCLIVTFTFITFYSTLSFEFVKFDDYQHLHQNPAVTDLNSVTLKKIWTEPYFGLYIPATYTFWGVEVELLKKISGINANRSDQLSPKLFHTTNLLFHVLNALLLFWLMCQLGIENVWGTLGTLFFALHPIQVESVAWISSFRDLFSTFWGLLFINLALKVYKKEDPLAYRPTIAWSAGLTLLFSLAVLSKPSAIVFLPAFIILGYQDQFQWQGSCKKFIGLWLVLAIASVVIVKQIQPDATVDFTLGFEEKMRLAIQTLSFYVKSTLWPMPLYPDYGLSLAYLLNQWKQMGIPFADVSVTIVSLAALASLSRKRQMWVSGILVSFIGISPYLGFLAFNFQNVSVVADRYMYAPMIGIGLFFASGKIRWPIKAFNHAVIGLMAILICALAYLSFKQCQVWKNDESLFTKMLQHNERSFYGHNGLGGLALLRGEANKAVAHFQEAIKLRPTYFQAHYSLARALQQQGQFQLSIQYFIKTINLAPDYIPAYRDLASVLIVEKRFTEAEETLLHGLKIEPVSADLFAVKGDLHRDQGNLETAIKYYEKAISSNPNHFIAHLNLGNIFFALNRKAEARGHYEACNHIDSELSRKEGLKDKMSSF